MGDHFRGPINKIKKMGTIDEQRLPFLFIVELEGFEPSSKQGNHMLSTCLFRPLFSCYDKTQTTNHSLIP